MRILDRYICKSVISLFLTCLLVFMFLYVIIDIFSTLEDIIKQHMPWQSILRFYLAYIPIIFVRVAPFSCLLATLYTFGRLNKENEVIAMRSAGLSIFQIAKPVIILGLLVSIAIFTINDRVVPKALAVTQKIKDDIQTHTKNAPAQVREPITNLTMYGLKNRLYFVNKFLPDTSTMQNIIILQHDEHQNIVKKIVASSGEYRDGVWRFRQSVTYDLDENGQVVGEPSYLDEEIMDIPETPNDFINQRQSSDTMTISQLDDYIRKLIKGGALSTARNFQIEFYQRFTMPFSSVILILIGIPFSLTMRKRATGLSSIGITIILALLYEVLKAVSVACGKSVLSPFLGASLSHVIAAATSIWLIRSVR